MRTLVITVHGIRTFGQWQERLEAVTREAVKTDDQIKFKHKHYGYFSVLKFLNPFARRTEARRFSVELAELLDDRTSSGFDRVCLVGHSFGTHIIAHALRALSDDLQKKVDTVILSGSVLSTRYPWENLLGSRVIRVVNDCGTRDWILPLNAILPFGSGVAGRNGFEGITESEFRNRYFSFGHSGYFYKPSSRSEVSDDNWFLKKYWVPLLVRDDAIEPCDERGDGLLSGLVTSFVARTEQLKWIPPTLALVIISSVIFVGTVSTWITDGAVRDSRGAAHVLQNSSSIMTTDSETTILWDASSGEEKRRYVGKPVAYSDGYLVLENSEFSGSEFFSDFSFINVETGREAKLELPRPIVSNQIRAKWADKKYFFLLSRAFLLENQFLFVSDLRTGSVVRTFEFPTHIDRGTRVLDDYRLLLANGPDDAPEVRSISTGQIVGHLRKPSDKVFRLWAIGIRPGTTQVATVQEVNNESDAERDDEPTLAGSGVSIRVWELSNEKPRILAESPLNMEDALAQFHEYDDTSPEGRMKFSAGLAVFKQAIVVRVILENSGGSGMFLYDPTLELLDHGSSNMPRGIIASEAREMTYFGKEDASLTLWDVNAAKQKRSLLNFGADLTEQLVISASGKLILGLKAGSKIQLWDIDGARQLQSFSVPSAKQAFFTLGTSAIATWQKGGTVSLWGDGQNPTAVLAGISDEGPPVVRWNPSRCELMVWSADGRRLRFISEWNVLGLFHIRRHRCG
jgi:hypothetical protein